MQELRRVPRRTWAALLLPAAAWTAYILFAWALVPAACASGLGVLLHVGTLACVAAAAGGLALAYGRRGDAGILPRLALALAPLFTLGVVLYWLAVLALDPCLRA